MTPEEQLAEWVKGNPIHNERMLGGHLIGECCPDFSCCKPELLAPVEIRELYSAAYKTDNTKVTSRMLGEFLTRMIDQHEPKIKVHIAGLEADRRELEG